MNEDQGRKEVARSLAAAKLVKQCQIITADTEKKWDGFVLLA